MITKNELKESIKKLSGVKMLVIGDLAIDEMIYGDTERISREAPVLILAHTHTNIILGGASNAAHNLATLNNAKVSVIGLYGDDYHAPILIEAFKNANINTEYLVQDKSRPTTVKTRISGACSQSVTQQIVRIDRQSKEFISGEVEEKLIENIKKAIPEHDGIILSDYHLGTLTKRVIDTAIEYAKKYNKTICVDSQKNLDRFKGVTTLTPNQPDTEKYLGYFIKTEDDLIRAGKEMLMKTNADNVLITRGEHGMAVFEKSGKHFFIPAFNKTKVFDVTGAGDTVIASYALALTAGLKPEVAAVIGNIAASIVIRTFGCATTTTDEIIQNVDKLNL
ncbi:bifunctional hydroxymethylpyrimidine kinase/phosphomethylpyrimidine kinase [bacterium]|nr:bifunctional hydroxymethylpyrimidine kinase/phosphomethylpyrimidine kinase [bacterium]